MGSINHQNETNLHNIRPIQRAFALAEMLVGLYGLVVPVLWASERTRILRERLAGVVDARLLVPPLALTALFGLAFAYRSFRFIFMPEAGQRITTFGELPELALYFAALMVGIVALREVERAARSVRHSALQPIGR